MPIFAKTRSFLRNLVWFHRGDSELDQEIRGYLEMRIEEKVRLGMGRAEAERAAHIELGGGEQVKERVREVRLGNWLRSVATDVRFGVRQLRKNPGFTAVAIVTLAVAIGANAVVFSVMNALILNPLHVRDAESLYAIQHGNETSLNQSYPDYLDLRDRNRSFDRLAADNGAQVGLDTGDNSARAWIDEVTGNYFDVLGIQPYLGRLIDESDDHGPNSAPYIVLSYAYWRNHFASDRNVVGRVVQVNRHPFTIIGVAPPDFHGTLAFFNPDFYIPLVNAEQAEPQKHLNDRSRRWVFMTFGHLKPGVAVSEAVADLNSIGAYLEQTYPKDDDKRRFTLARPSLYGDFLGKPVRAFMAALMLLAGLILIAACANLGSLFAARAADRSREVALRLALGAPRSRVLRQLFTEALLLSGIGGFAGICASVFLMRGLSAWQPFARWPIHLTVAPDTNVYGVAVLLTLASGFLFGAVPVRQVLHTDPYEIVKSGTVRSVGRRLSARELALVVEIAICAVLVTSSFVAVRGLIRSLHGNFGFEPRNAVVADTDLSMAGYSGENVIAMQRRMIDALQKIPGVTSVGMIDAAPLASGGFTGGLAFKDETTDLRPGNAAASGYLFSISPEYFEAAETTLLAGRGFSWHDDTNAPPVAVVNQEFARRVFGTETKALGGYFKKKDGTRVQVVGIVGDGKYQNITEGPEPAMFLPVLQSPLTQAYFIVRSTRDDAQIVPAIRNTVRGLDTSLPLYIEAWSEAMQAPLFGPRMATLSLGVLGAMAALLSITGIFGMVAYSTSKRLRELGIRMALGAQRKEVLVAALGRAVRLLGVGSAAGLLLGLMASRVLAAIVYEATPRDPVVLTGVVIAMAMLGLLATWIPAQRALGIDPAKLLREE